MPPIRNEQQREKTEQNRYKRTMLSNLEDMNGDHIGLTFWTP